MRLAANGRQGFAMKILAYASALTMLAATSAFAGVKSPTAFLRQGPPSRFSIEIDGVQVLSSIGDIVSESAIVFDNAGNPQPGAKLNKLTLTREFGVSTSLYRWRKAVLDGKVDRRSISVIFHNDAGQEAGRMNFYNCWPSKWVGPSLNARNGSRQQEQLEIVWENMDIKTP